jgi:hypothetical protein
MVDFRIRPVYFGERTPLRNEEEAVFAIKPAQSFLEEKIPWLCQFYGSVSL